MRVNTDKYVVCRNCSEAERFGDVTNKEAERLARKYGWKGSKEGDPICPECQSEKVENKSK